MANINVIIKSMDNKGINHLYDSRSLNIMQAAEDAFEKEANRVEEIKNFARKAGVKRIGIAHCISFPKETEIVKQFLSDEFEVTTIDCKCGRITKQEMLGSAGNGIMCNPAGQAEFLKDNDTELNISLGLCIGHDMIFNQKSKSPVTTLVVKDRMTKHSPIESIKNITKNK